MTAEKTTMAIKADWQPTIENINQLPAPIRHYIHHLSVSHGLYADIVHQAYIVELNYHQLLTYLENKSEEQMTKKVDCRKCESFDKEKSNINRRYPDGKKKWLIVCAKYGEVFVYETEKQLLMTCKKFIDRRKKELGKRLKKIRNALKFNQNQMGLKCNIERSAISRYEIGEFFPSTLLILNLIENLQVNAVYLLTGEGDMFQPGISSGSNDKK